MKLIKRLILKPFLKCIIRKNLVTEPKVIELEEKKCIGFTIKTSFTGNQKKKDIPPFYHKIYDNNKLDTLKTEKNDQMYCVFEFLQNSKDFNYYITVEKNSKNLDNKYAEITLQKGKYVQAEVIKRNHTAVALNVLYIRKIWIDLNGYIPRNSPIFIVYDKRFHENYQKYGYKDGTYLGNPLATVYVPVQ